MNQVPFIWEYFGEEIKMLFVGGMVGVFHDEKDNSVMPTFGYAVTEDKCINNEKILELNLEKND